MPVEDTGPGGALCAIAWIVAAIGLLMRLAIALTLPMFESDSIALFTAARDYLDGQPMSMAHTVVVELYARLWQIAGTSLFVARIPDLFAGAALVLLAADIATQRAGKLAGALAAMLASTTSLAAIFGSIAKPYALLSFFILAGIWAWDRAVRDADRRVAVSIVSGLLLGLAFGCHTFAAFGAFPLAWFGVRSVGGSLGAKRLRLPTLVAGLSFGVVAGALIAWRLPTFGWSIFNDFVSDWRFDIAKMVWSARWEGLTNIFSISPFLLAPGVGAFLARPRDKREWPIGTYLALLIAANVVLYLANPVNHFPRVLMPSMAPVAVFAGIGLAHAVTRRPSAFIAFFVQVTISAFMIVVETRSGRPLVAGFVHLVKPPAVLLAIVACASLAYAAARFGRKREREGFVTPIQPVMLAAAGVGALVFAGTHAHATLDRQVAYFQGRLAAVQACQTDSGTAGGGDVALLLLGGENNYAWVTDLPEANLAAAFSNDVLSGLQSARVTCVVVSWKDPEGEQAMLAEFARSRGLAMLAERNVFLELEDTPVVRTLYANEHFATYALPQYVPGDGRTAERLRAFSPPIRSRLWSIPDGA
ncbi:glycosyltransferase family 39 protein [bacterium]|nr:glycosyltransferase family 39 protein [bacterium]